MKPLFPILAVACAATIALIGANVAGAQATPATSKARKSIAPVKSADLNGKAFALPADFSASRTLLLVAFQRDHQDLIDGWVEGMKLQETDKDWFELPVVGAMNPMGQKFLDGAMRSGIRGDDKRSRVITLYTDPKKWIAPLGKTKTDTIYIVVAAKNGEVLALQEGAFSQEKARKISAQWRVK